MFVNLNHSILRRNKIANRVLRQSFHQLASKSWMTDEREAGPRQWRQHPRRDKLRGFTLDPAEAFALTKNEKF